MSAFNQFARVLLASLCLLFAAQSSAGGYVDIRYGHGLSTYHPSKHQVQRGHRRADSGHYRSHKKFKKRLHKRRHRHTPYSSRYNHSYYGNRHYKQRYYVAPHRGGSVHRHRDSGGRVGIYYGGSRSGVYYSVPLSGSRH